MKRALYLAVALSAGCAAPRAAQTQQAQATASAPEVETRCHLIGSLASQAHYNPRGGILDERTTPGPSRIIWMNRANTSHVLTPEGDIYECDRIL